MRPTNNGRKVCAISECHFSCLISDLRCERKALLYISDVKRHKLRLTVIDLTQKSFFGFFSFQYDLLFYPTFIQVLFSKYIPVLC